MRTKTVDIYENVEIGWKFRYNRLIVTEKKKKRLPKLKKERDAPLSRIEAVSKPFKMKITKNLYRIAHNSQNSCDSDKYHICLKEEHNGCAGFYFLLFRP